MTTRFSVGDEVYIRAVVTGIGIDSTGTKYRVDLPNIDPTYKPSMTISEENLISADVEDFRRETADEGDGC